MSSPISIELGRVFHDFFTIGETPRHNSPPPHDKFNMNSDEGRSEVREILIKRVALLIDGFLAHFNEFNPERDQRTCRPLYQVNVDMLMIPT